MGFKIPLYAAHLLRRRIEIVNQNKRLLTFCLWNVLIWPNYWFKLLTRVLTFNHKFLVKFIRLCLSHLNLAWLQFFSILKHLFSSLNHLVFPRELNNRPRRLCTLWHSSKILIWRTSTLVGRRRRCKPFAIFMIILQWNLDRLGNSRSAVLFSNNGGIILRAEGTEMTILLSKLSADHNIIIIII